MTHRKGTSHFCIKGSLFDYDINLLKIATYKQTLEDKIPQIVAASGTGDESVVSAIAHELKGSSGYLGAETVESLCTKIDALCKESNFPATAKYVQELKVETDEVIKLLVRYMAVLRGEEPPAEEEGEDKKEEKKADEKKDDEKKDDEKKDKDSTKEDNKDSEKKKPASP